MAIEQGLVAQALSAYEIGGELGRGGWGVVIEARHRRLERWVAIKQLPRAFSADPEVRRRFHAEARLVASLDHPHIVPIYDYVEHEGLCLIVMERLSGGTLWARFTSGPIDQRFACTVTLGILSALDCAHRSGVLHRDMKPENVLFTEGGTPKVTDFGIAKVVGGATSGLTRTGEVLGTPAYMAPEQILGKELTPATDLYGVAVMLYELLARRLPFEGGSDPFSVLYKHVNEEPPPLGSVVPAAIVGIIERSLRKDPAARFATAEAMAVALATAATTSWGEGWHDATGATLSVATPVARALVSTSESADPAPRTVDAHLRGGTADEADMASAESPTVQDPNRSAVALELALANGRHDLAAWMTGRARPVATVIGEFMTGKSSLVRAITGEAGDRGAWSPHEVSGTNSDGDLYVAEVPSPLDGARVELAATYSEFTGGPAVMTVHIGRPVTDRERRALERMRASVVPVTVALTRADLYPNGHDLVAQRQAELPDSTVVAVACGGLDANADEGVLSLLDTLRDSTGSLAPERDPDHVLRHLHAEARLALDLIARIDHEADGFDALVDIARDSIDRVASVLVEISRSRLADAIDVAMENALVALAGVKAQNDELTTLDPVSTWAQRGDDVLRGAAALARVVLGPLAVAARDTLSAIDTAFAALTRDLALGREASVLVVAATSATPVPATLDPTPVLPGDAVVEVIRCVGAELDLLAAALASVDIMGGATPTGADERVIRDHRTLVDTAEGVVAGLEAVLRAAATSASVALGAWIDDRIRESAELTYATVRAACARVDAVAASPPGAQHRSAIELLSDLDRLESLLAPAEHPPA